MRTFHRGVAGLDITQGLPRVEEIFEARPPKNRAFVSEFDGMVKIEDGKDLAKLGRMHNVKIVHEELDQDIYPLSKTKKGKGTEKIMANEGDKIKKGDVLYTDADGEVLAQEHRHR